jgi:2-succinyl-5-enolpyruvyl-6-hydroxy-3-cyclohexene-1-carboxylate synthase
VNPAVGWLADWQEADAAVHVDAHTFSSKNVVRAVHDSATQRDQLWVSASMAIREADDAFALRGAMPMVFMNRGANGIDGLIASASGAALKHPGRTFLIIGDVAFLHDMSSLVIPALEQRPNLTIVVLDNNGGKIFKTLEQGAAEFDNLFDRVYGTPHGLALDAIATSAGWSSTSVESLDDLRAALADGTSVIVANLSQ